MVMMMVTAVKLKYKMKTENMSVQSMEKSVNGRSDGIYIWIHIWHLFKQSQNRPSVLSNSELQIWSYRGYQSKKKTLILISGQQRAPRFGPNAIFCGSKIVRIYITGTFHWPVRGDNSVGSFN